MHFKSRQKYQDFFQQFFKEGVQQMLQGELDEHLGYKKHSAEGYNGTARDQFAGFFIGLGGPQTGHVCEAAIFG